MNTCDLPVTTAQTFLASHEATLLADLERVREGIADTYRALPLADLKAEAQTLGIKPVPVNKAPLVEALTNRYTAKTGPQATLNDARRRAHHDEHADKSVQGLIDAAAKGAAATATAAGEGIHALRTHLKWNADEIMALSQAAAYADTYLTLRARGGMDPREAAIEIGRSALRDALTVGKNPSGLRMDGHGLDRVAEGIGAMTFLRAVAVVLPDEYTAVL